MIHQYPPRSNLPILQKLVVAYRDWQSFLPHIAKTTRLSIGVKIDALLIEVIEELYIASFLSPAQKLPHLKTANTKLDLAQFFLQVIWDMKALDTKQYIHLAKQLTQIGRDLGGWIKQVEKNAPAPAL